MPTRADEWHAGRDPVGKTAADPGLAEVLDPHVASGRKRAGCSFVRPRAPRGLRWPWGSRLPASCSGP